LRKALPAFYHKLCANSLQLFDNFSRPPHHSIPMKTNRFIIGLTTLNVLILFSTLFRANSAAAPESAPILRCRELYLIDDKGRVRAELKVTPPDPNVKMPDGSKGYPETVLFRLISSAGAPYVKISAAEDGAGMVLGGDGTYTQLLSRGTNSPFIKIVTKDHHEQIMKAR
jgi:hypothetical protein